MNNVTINPTEADTKRPSSSGALWARQGRLWHRRLAWVGAAALLLFGLSGLTHPLMTWFGPQPAAFFPPQAHFDHSDIAAWPDILAKHQINQAQQVKILPTFDGNILQVTDSEHAIRRYFDLRTGAERVDFDRRHAEWLARHYTGLNDTPVRELTLQTTFDHAYPDVNRLLPVWRVVFDSDDGLTAFVHTELNALAALGNSTRTTQQGIFRSLHSFSWLGEQEALRVIILTGLTLSLIGLGLAGLVLVFALPGRTTPPGQRRWHRWLALGLWLPLLAFAFSGLCHLLHHANPPSGATFRPAAPLDLAPLLQLSPDWNKTLAHHHPPALNSVTLLQTPSGELLLRLAQPAGHPGEHVQQHARFEGTPTEQSSQLVSLSGPVLHPWSDRDLARHFAAAHLKLNETDLIDAELVTRFGPDYDFRNKRLPVWRVRHAGGSAFIDPSNGALVDSVTRPDHWEGMSFSHLHKWNFLTPILGREGRDLAVTAVVVALLVSTILGVSMLLRSRCNRWRARYGATLLRRKSAH